MPLQIALHITVRHGKLNNAFLGFWIYIVCNNSGFKEKPMPHSRVYKSYILFGDVVRYFNIQTATLALENIWQKALA